MAAQRAWDWDLEDMKSAGAVLNDHEGSCARGVFLSAEPLPISGFTPINQARHAPEGEYKTNMEKGHGKTEAKACGKVKAPKLRKTQASTKASASNPRKITASQKSRKRTRSGEPQCQDISKGLSRTKPVAPRASVETIKTVSPADITLLEQKSDADLMQDAFLAFETQDVAGAFIDQGQSLGLSDQYQAKDANPTIKKGRFNIATSADHSLAGTELTATNKDVESGDAGFSAERPITDNEISNQNEPWIEAAEAAFSDFVLPPSAQGDNTLGLTENFPTSSPLAHEGSAEAALKNCSDNHDMFSDGDDTDDFPFDATDLESMMQSVVPNAVPNNGHDEWRSQDLFDAYIMDDESWKDGLRQTSDPVPNIIITHKKDSNLPNECRSNSESSPHEGSNSVCILARVSGNAGKPKQKSAKPFEGTENYFDDDDLDKELIEISAADHKTIQPSTPLTSPDKPSTPKLQWLPPKLYVPEKRSQIPASPTHVPHVVPFNSNGEPLPFTRKPFPQLIRDRSPILGLTNQTVLRTCFRIGEALNAATLASRTNTDAVIELYARIVNSERETGSGFKQFFRFGDLFTDNPPYLSAVYSLWKGVGLWDMDSKGFLGKQGRGKIARVLGRIKRCDQGGGCEMFVLSIWEVDWEDVGVAKGIVCL